MHTRTSATLMAVALIAGTTAAAAQDTTVDIRTETISHAQTPTIHVWAPTGDGPFPVVYALHGTGVDFATDWDVVAAGLARRGVVTFAIDYHASDWQTGDFTRVTREAECGYRYVREVASEYGWDAGSPVAMVGHSIGGTYVLGGGLDVTRFGPGGAFDECFDGATRPDLVVPVAGCHFEAYGRSFDLVPAQYGTGDVSLLFIGAEHDAECPAWQSEKAATVFADAGYEAASMVVPGATHLSLLGHELIEDEWMSLPDGGDATAVVEALVEALGAAG